jgi:hypothetical protein
MREVKVPNMAITVPKGSAFACETPPMAPKMHLLAAVVARRGGGKGVITAALIERLQVVDRLICVSPSASSNKVLLDRFSKILDPQDIFHDVNDPTVHDKVIAKIEQERDNWEEYLAKKKRYEQAATKVRSDTPLFRISDEHLLQFHEGPPKYRGKTNVTNPACILVWYDDVVGSGSMMGRGARRLANFALMHRHTGQLKDGGALGCSILWNTQSYRTHGGLPKAVRNNLTLLLLGKVTSAKDLQALYEEMAGEVSEETFYRIYEQATAEPFGFLLLDMHPKKGHPSPYRKGLDTFLIP